MESISERKIIKNKILDNIGVLNLFLHDLKIQFIFCHHGGNFTEMRDGQICAASAELKNRLSGIRDGI